MYVGPRRIRMIRRKLLAWASTHTREFPWRQPGATPYEILVAELLLRRTTAKAAAREFERFLMEYPDVEELSRATPRRLEKSFRPIGLRIQRSTAAREMASYIVERHGGRLPDNATDLLLIPHVGPYGAAAILSLGFGVAAAMVDSNVIRVLGRVFSPLRYATPAKIREVAEAVLPRRNHKRFNLGLLDLAAIICVPVSPHCSICPILRACDFGRSKDGDRYSLRGRIEGTHDNIY